MQGFEPFAATPVDAFKWAQDYLASGKHQLQQHNPLHISTSLWLYKYVVEHTREDHPIHIEALKKITEINELLAAESTPVSA